jgi:hypothetical protein
MKFNFLSRKLFSTSRAAILLLVASGLGNALMAQSVVVQFLKGKSGKPVGPGQRVYVAFQGGLIRTILNLHTDDQGIVEFDVEGAKTFRVAPIGYVTCGEQAFDAPLKDYSVDDVVNDGLLTRNTCGKNNNAVLNIRVQPGKLLYFVKYQTWESFKNLN